MNEADESIRSFLTRVSLQLFRSQLWTLADNIDCSYCISLIPMCWQVTNCTIVIIILGSREV